MYIYNVLVRDKLHSNLIRRVNARRKEYAKQKYGYQISFHVPQEYMEKMLELDERLNVSKKTRNILREHINYLDKIFPYDMRLYRSRSEFFRAALERHYANSGELRPKNVPRADTETELEKFYNKKVIRRLV